MPQSYSAPQLLWEIDVAAVVAILALIASVLFFALAEARNSRTRFLDNFGRIYERTFSLRQKLSGLTQEHDNEDFFYELDRIWTNEGLREEVLDYLTEMENFFFLVVGHFSVQRSLERLMSLPLYERLLFFYGFIIKHRQETNNRRFFLNYEKALEIISNMKKIKQVTVDDSQKCYIGIRSSDHQRDNGYFQSDICIFSEETDSTIYPCRPNQNTPNKDIIPYIVSQTERIKKKSPRTRFAFYNGKMAYSFPKEFHNSFIALNSLELLQMLNNKVEMKRWLAEHHIPVLSYETFLGQELSFEKLQARFGAAGSCVIQSGAGGGGVGTYLVYMDQPTSFPTLQPLQRYLVSAYETHSVSVNTHVFIAAKQTVLTPGSLQLIVPSQGQLCYRGADYIAFRQLPVACKERIRELSLQIANRLREAGYRGVAGLDFLVNGRQEVYCMEINPRYQASTSLLDLYLNDHTQSSLLAGSVFELNEQAFSNRMATTLSFDDTIDFSCYFYYKGDIPLDHFLKKRQRLLENGVTIRDDGFLRYNTEEKLESSSYLFEAVFPHSISGISPDLTLWLNDNVIVQDKPKDLLDLKIALLNQGISGAPEIPNIKNGVYQSIDIHYLSGPYAADVLPVYMNCVIGTNLAQYSPFALENCADKKGTLTYYGEEIAQVEIELDPLDNFSDTDRRILYLATDRLRIKMIAGCEYKNMGVGCRFCDLPFSDVRFTRNELCHALKVVKESQLEFRHILIGGGTCLSATIWEDIQWLCKHLKKDDFFRDKPISLMSIPPTPEVLQALHRSELAEVAFNIEVSDDALAKALMPGKRGQGKAFHYQALEAATQIFGVGNVRCALLVGLDREEDLVQEVLSLAEKGIIPCLSALRSLSKTERVGLIHPDNAYLRRIYKRCEQALQSSELQIQALGPICRACQNNMLVI